MAGRRPSRAALARDIDVRARTIRLLVLDVDGVLTDGRITIDARGRGTRTFHGADRTMVALLMRGGIDVVGLLPRRPTATPAWARAMGIATVLAGAGNGLDSVRRYCGRRRMPLDAVAYVGWDVLDLPLTAAVGLAIAVADAAPHVQRESQWVTNLTGGGGVVRVVGERLLRAQGKWGSTIGEIWRQWE